MDNSHGTEVKRLHPSSRAESQDPLPLQSHAYAQQPQARQQFEPTAKVTPVTPTTFLSQVTPVASTSPSPSAQPTSQSQEVSQPAKQKKRSAVQRDEIIAHLRLLAVFHKLKLDVQARAPHNPTGLWTVFLSYAVEKFSAWIENVIERDGANDDALKDEEFPTIDVVMVWHAYVLHPLEYYKDCQKQPQGLLRIKSFPIKRLAEVIDTLGLEPRHPVPAFGSPNTASHPNSLSSKRNARNAQLGPQFSLDLVAAVKRQASFIAQVAAVGWTQPRPKGIDTVAASSIDKYHGFLKKLWENPEALAVPTLEIDLAWHTHQLNMEVYRQDSMMLFGRILQHDDDIPSPELNKAFQRHSFDWQVRKPNMFHMDYSGGNICTGFRPVAIAAPGPFSPRPSTSPSRPSSRDSSRTSSEVSLQEFYRIAQEKHLYGDGIGKESNSTSSFSAPSSSERDSPQSSLAVSLPSSSNTSLQSSLTDHSIHAKEGENSLGGFAVNGKPQSIMMRPSNDSLTTILGRPSSSGNGARPPSSGNGIRPPSSGYGARPPSSGINSSPHSRKSSFSDNGSAIFAYSPPPSRGTGDTRGAFDRPPSSRLRLGSAGSSPSLRPPSAGSSMTPTAQRPTYKLVYQVSSSTGTMYTATPRSLPTVQGSPAQSLDGHMAASGLPRTPSLTALRQLSAHGHGSQSSHGHNSDTASLRSTIREQTYSPNSSNVNVNVGLLKSPSNTNLHIPYPPSSWKRPSSSGNVPQPSPLSKSVTLPQRPSTSAGPVQTPVSVSTTASISTCASGVTSSTCKPSDGPKAAEPPSQSRPSSKSSARPTSPRKSISIGGSLNLFRRPSTANSQSSKLNKVASESNLLNGDRQQMPSGQPMFSAQYAQPTSSSSSRFVEAKEMTAHTPSAKPPYNRGLERPQTAGRFSKKATKPEKPVTTKRPWYRFW